MIEKNTDIYFLFNKGIKKQSGVQRQAGRGGRKEAMVIHGLENQALSNPEEL